MPLPPVTAPSAALIGAAAGLVPAATHKTTNALVRSEVEWNVRAWTAIRVVWESSVWTCPKARPCVVRQEVSHAWMRIHAS